MSINLNKAALSGVVGTTFMSIFSSLVSEKKDRQFREHEILSELIKIFPIDKPNRLLLAWIGHYSTGITFNILNQHLLKKIKSSPTFLNGLLLGVLNGTIGITIWKTIFEFHPSPPNISLKRYLGHLMLAHLVFATFSNMGMRVISPKSTNQLPAI